MSSSFESIAAELRKLSTCEIADALIVLKTSPSSSKPFDYSSLRINFIPDFKQFGGFDPDGDGTGGGGGDEDGSGDVSVVGRAFTVQMVTADTKVDNPPKGHHVDLAPPSSILLISGPALPTAFWGGLMSSGAKARGLNGAIVDGRVRDLGELRGCGFPLWAKGTSSFGQKGFVKAGAYQVPITLNGPSSSRAASDKSAQSLITPPPFTVHPNDLIIADSNGILVLPFNQAQDPSASSKSGSAQEDEQDWSWLDEVIRTAKQGKEVDEKCKEDLEAGRGGVQEVFKRWRGK